MRLATPSGERTRKRIDENDEFFVWTVSWLENASVKNATFYPLKETGPFTEQTASSTTIHLIGRAV